MPPFLLSLLGVLSIAGIYVVGLVVAFDAAPLLTALALIVSVVFVAWLASEAPVRNDIPD